MSALEFVKELRLELQRVKSQGNIFLTIDELDKNLDAFEKNYLETQSLSALHVDSEDYKATVSFNLEQFRALGVMGQSALKTLY